MAFGEKLQEVRKQSGMTQETFAEQLHVSRQAVSRWESGRGYPEIEKILYICHRYHTTLDALFADELPPIEAEEAEVEQPIAGKPLKRSFVDFLMRSLFSSAFHARYMIPQSGKKSKSEAI